MVFTLDAKDPAAVDRDFFLVTQVHVTQMVFRRPKSLETHPARQLDALTRLVATTGVAHERLRVRLIDQAAVAEQPRVPDFLQVAVIGVIRDLVDRRKREVAKLTGNLLTRFRLSRAVAPNQVHFHRPRRGKATAALGARQPGVHNGLRVAAVGVGVKLAAVGEHLRAERARYVRLLRVNFAALLDRRFVQQTRFLVNLESRAVDEQLGAVAARHPVGLNKLLSMTLIDVELEVVIVEEGHRAVGANNFLLAFPFGRCRVRISVFVDCIGKVVAGTIFPVSFSPGRLDELVAGLAKRPSSSDNKVSVFEVGVDDET